MYDPAARMQSAWRYNRQRHHARLLNLSLSSFVSALRSSVHPNHSAATTLYQRSLRPAVGATVRNPAPGGSVFLIKQRDYLRGIDCTQQELHVLCTERLEMDWMVLAKSFGVEKGASIHNNNRKGICDLCYCLLGKQVPETTRHICLTCHACHI